MLNRKDPFYATKKPHTNSYLETLHRTYGEAPGALPGRSQETFRRALQFREREKKHYTSMEEELRLTKDRYNQLQNETVKLQGLFEELSKVQADARSSNKQDESVSDPGGGGDHSGSKGGTETAADSPATDSQLQREVLHGGVRGQGEEHPAEGPEHASGSVDRGGEQSEPSKPDGEA